MVLIATHIVQLVTHKVWLITHIVWLETHKVQLVIHAVQLATDAVWLVTHMVRLVTDAVWLVTQAVRLATDAVWIVTQAVRLATDAVWIVTQAVRLATDKLVYRDYLHTAHSYVISSQRSHSVANFWLDSTTSTGSVTSSVHNTPNFLFHRQKANSMDPTIKVHTVSTASRSVFSKVCNVCVHHYTNLWLSAVLVKARV